ncbi:molecular chaperone HtpG [Ruminococcaceae bacterium OttesenSCG-928-L11]|nr:molecular chaperone HtpG [Ruminococcaceae bacterium OttesenSCG-928-L11]
MAKKQFKAESKRLLDLMINSIYTHKEIFLREIISNASDAVDKLCYKSLTDSSVGMSRSDFYIEISVDKENRTLTVSDNGIGMTKEELETNLGTIAKSGSLQFKKDMEGEAKPEENIDIIGQFGVGFYSAFMVSDTVTVRTKAHGDAASEAWEWQSTGTDGYTISACEKDAPGTEIVMHIKEDTEDESYSRFLEEHTIVNLVKKYSDYIRYPIRMEREKRRPVEVEAEDGEKKTEYETYTEVETLNSMVPIWQRNKNEVTNEDYNAFYKEKFFDFEDPLLHTHVDAEGVVSYKALLFIPAKAAYDYYTKEYKRGLQLYSSGVMIMDKCEDLIPEYFRFVRGVVDSPDLSLNISRELLQHDRQLKVIATNIEKKIKNELLKLCGKDREKYEAFWSAFGLQLKYGVMADYGAHKETLQDLLLFRSSDSDKFTTLAEYVGRMKEDQEHIYYATGESAAHINNLPQLEKVREKGFEVLYFTEDVDEFAIQMMRTYMEKEFKSINSGDLGLETEEEKKELEKKQEESKDLLDFIKETLGDKIKEVKVSHNLVNYPVCLTAGGHMSFEMEKYLNSFQNESGAKADRILELNPSNALFDKLQGMIDGGDADKEKARQYIQVLYHQACLNAGLPIEDTAAYSNLIFGLL